MFLDLWSVLQTCIESPWRVFPASALMLLGAGVTIWGLRSMPWGLRRPFDVTRWVQGFRRAVVGLALFGVAGAWLWHQPWLLTLALVIGGEEVLETSVILSALRRQQTQATTPSIRPGDGTAIHSPSGPR